MKQFTQKWFLKKIVLHLPKFAIEDVDEFVSSFKQISRNLA